MLERLTTFVLFRIIVFKSVRFLLRVLTYIRCPALFFDPTALVARLWGPETGSPPLGSRKTNAGFYSPQKETTLLVIIPFRDKWELTQKALDSLVSQDTSLLRITVALVDNASRPEIHASVQSYVTESQANGSPFTWRLLYYDFPFNFSRLNNLAFQNLGGEKAFEHILFLNNDVELTSSTTLNRLLLEVRSRGECMGALSCTLLYLSGRVQHSFVAPGVVLVGAHPLKGTRYNPFYSWYRATRRVPAVTGALMWVPANLFAEVGGFDEGLPTAYQDVDLCLQFQKAGRSCFTMGSLTAIHHESVTRREQPKKLEAERMYLKWGSFLTENPGVPKALSRWSEHTVLSIGEPPFPWTWLYPKV